MKKKCFLRSILLGLIIFCGCSEYDDSALRNNITDLNKRVETLESWQATVNNNIASLQEVINALQSNDYVTGVTKYIENNQEVGYTITLAKSSPIIIRHGQNGNSGEKGETGEKGDAGSNGTDGNTPIIGVALDNGAYYWTLNGTWLLNSSSNKIPVTGAKGDKGDSGNDGQNAVAPQVRIDMTTNEWEISTNDGQTWTPTGVKATGNKGDKGDKGENGTSSGDGVFSGISETDNSVIFTLASGGNITLQKYQSIGINFSNPRSFVPGEVKNIIYSLTGNAPVSISVIGNLQGWKFIVDPDNNKFKITAPTTLTDDNQHIELGILIFDGKEQTVVRPLTLLANPIEDGVLISGTLWATKNVDECYTFAETPGSFGKYFQFNRNIAIAATATSLPAYTNDNPPVEWQPANNPCPEGWRLPTRAEMDALLASGWRKVTPSADNWNVDGIWFGPDAATATSENMGAAIFLPAAGDKYGATNPTTYFLNSVNYWTGSLYNYDNKYVMAMWNAAYWDKDDIYLTVDLISQANQATGKSIRCVHE
ncbi:hypothetical protein EZS27_032524 [termite gut metagenome]|uniref:DUF4988 domain-containing protein n=1 Tax=termite gut metagenome TaxID=433724 RepID=A0A5J4Q8A8_9ZZZZ